MTNLNVPVAYLNTDMPKDNKILMKLRGDFVDIMFQVNPEYEQNVRYENGNKIVSISGQVDLWFHLVCIFVV